MLFLPSGRKRVYPAFYALRFGKTRTSEDDVLRTEPIQQITFYARYVAEDGVILIGCQRQPFGKNCSAGPFAERASADPAPGEIGATRAVPL